MKLSDQITRRHLFVAFGTSSQTGSLSSVDLAATRDEATVALTASDGSVAPIAGADASTAGVMTAADKAKLDKLPSTTTREFGAFSDIPGVAVGTGITHLRTAGHSIAGDGGSALYKRVASEPAHPGKAQSADGAWWEIVPTNGQINVRQLGAGDGVTSDKTAFDNAAAAVNAIAGADVVFVPAGDYDLVSGISLNGLNVTLLGEGTENTIIRASAPTGPVIDLTGWTAPVVNNSAPVVFGGFRVIGDGLADATKAKIGIKAPSASGVRFRDIGIQDTGGPCLQTGTIWWAVFEYMTFNRPVGADTNDVPYLDVNDWCNGCMFIQPRFRSTVATDDGSAVFKVRGNTATPEFSHVIAPSFEFQHVPENGALIDLGAKGWIIDGAQLFDVVSDRTFTNACAIRLVSSNGSEVRGVIEGDSDAPASLPFGIIIEGDRNRVVGMRGFDENNVLLTPGTKFNYIELGGQESGTDSASKPGVVNNSGNSDNVIFDHSTRTYDIAGKFKIFGNQTFTFRAEFFEGLKVTPRFSGGDGLRVQGNPGQTGRVFEIRNDVSAIHFAVEADGKIQTNQTSAATTPGSVTNKMPVYNASGTLIGYVPIYDSIT